jgi:hypothetical protein
MKSKRFLYDIIRKRVKGGNMEKIFEIYNKEAYNKIYSTENALNLVRVRNNFLVHSQIERKDGRLYMRAKKRDLLTCS